MLQALSGAVFWPVGFVVSAGLLHLVAVLVGASQRGFPATARALGYAWGPMVLGGVPGLNLLALLYTAVLTAWGLKELHGTSWERAWAAVGLPLLLVCCCSCCFVFLAVGSGLSALAATP